MGCLITRKLPPRKRYWEEQRKKLTLTFKIYRSAMFTVTQSGFGYKQLAMHRADIKVRPWREKT